MSAQQEFPDPRATFAQILAMGDVPVEEETFAVVVEPIRLDSGQVLAFQAPHVAPFYLLTAKALRDTAEPRRQAALTNTVTLPDGQLRPSEPAASFDALEGLAIAVILSAAAIESHANDAIGRLDETTSITVKRRGLLHVYERDSMVKQLGLDEKVGDAVPMLASCRSIKGRTPWARYRKVTRLRNDLVHPKREPQADPDNPGPFGRLLLGEGSTAPEDAASVIEALEPGWIPAHVRPLIGLE